MTVKGNLEDGWDDGEIN